MMYNSISVMLLMKHVIGNPLCETYILSLMNLSKSRSLYESVLDAFSLAELTNEFMP